MAAYWNQFPKKRPRREAKDGIKARSRSGRIGERWWSERFIAALEALTDGSRLQRGRSYARTGQVMGLDVASGLVTARVQGSRRTPYQVRIAVQPLTDPQWRHVEEAMAGQAIFLAALLAGEMPRDIEDAFAAAGHSLFPTDARDLRSECSCPDWANPCKHVAATAYILGEAFDDDPFLMFTLRGRDRTALLERLRERRVAAGEIAGGADAAGAVGAVGSAEAAGAADAEDSAGAAGVAGAAGATTATRSDGPVPPGADDSSPIVATDDPPLEALLRDFWRAGPEPDPHAPLPRAAEIPDALLRELGPIPVEAGGAGTGELLAPAYAAITAAAARRALGGPD